jgi:hypothetical protein
VRALLTAILALLLLGCSTGEPEHIETEEVRRAAVEAGFDGVGVHSNRAAMEEAARRMRHPSLAENAADALDLDVVYVETLRADSVLTAARFPSTEAAKLRMEDTVAAAGDAQLALLREHFPELDPARVREIRVCNVVISSYDDRGDARLRHRVDRMVELLHRRCRD